MSPLGARFEDAGVPAHHAARQAYVLGLQGCGIDDPADALLVAVHPCTCTARARPDCVRRGSTAGALAFRAGADRSVHGPSLPRPRPASTGRAAAYGAIAANGAAAP
jgi:hypothetical protein